MRGVAEMLRDAFPTAAGVGATTATGAVAGAPGWLIGLGQAVIVVVMTLRGLDRRLKEIKAAQEELSGQVHTLKGRINGLACVRGDDEEEGDSCSGEG